jgi:hypothetical protein
MIGANTMDDRNEFDKIIDVRNTARNQRKAEIVSQYICLVIILACFSYPITTTILLQIQVPLGTSNIILKFIFVIIYLTLIFKTNQIGGNVSSMLIPIFLFFLVYSVRLVVDLELRNVRMTGYSPIYIYLYYFLLTILPAFAIAFSSRYISIPILFKYIFWSLIFANVLLMSLIVSTGFADLQAALNSRVQVDGLIEDTAVINPLTIGMMGASLGSLTLARLCLLPSKTRLETVVYFLLSFLGISNVLLSASRGPFLALVISIVFIISLAVVPARRSNLPDFGTVIFYLSFPILCVMTLFLSTETFLFDRLVSFFGDQTSRTSEARSYSFENAFQDFVDSPFIGNQFVGTLDNFYPHNIPLEVLMSTGVVGGGFFFFAFFLLILSIFKICKDQRSSQSVLILIVAFVHLLSGLTSGSIVSSPEFWILFVLVIGIAQSKLKSGEVIRKS